MLLAPVDTEYRLLWVDLGSSRSSSDAQVFNRSDLREKIEDGNLGLPAPEPLGEGGPDYLRGWRHICLYAMNGETLQKKTTHIGKKSSKLQEVVENVFVILVSRFRVLLGTLEQRPKVVRDIIFTCVVFPSKTQSTSNKFKNYFKPNHKSPG